MMYILGLTLSYLQSKQHIQLNYHRIKTSLTKSFHWLLSASSVCRPDDVIGDVVRDDDNNPSPPPPPPRPLCLHSLLYDVIPYWGQIVPSTIPIEAQVQGSDKNGFLHPSFKSSGFCCQDFSVIQFHWMLQLFRVDMLCNLRGGGTGSLMFVES